VPDYAACTILLSLNCCRVSGQNSSCEFHHFPLIQMHPMRWPQPARESAGDQGKFWEMNDLLFEHQHECRKSECGKRCSCSTRFSSVWTPTGSCNR